MTLKCWSSGINRRLFYYGIEWYRTSTGKPVGVSHTPDFFVIRKQEAGWEEWKPEAKLAKLSREKPNRYVRLDDGHWSCPPGEEYAAAFGLFYRLRSSEELNPLLVRNLVFLGDYLRDVPPVPEEVTTRVLASSSFSWAQPRGVGQARERWCNK